jgi:hypothetical protein
LCTTKRLPDAVAAALPTGSRVLEKSRFSRYWRSFGIAIRAKLCGGAHAINPHGGNSAEGA